MTELITEAIAWMNIPLTVALGLMFVYWLTVIVGVADLDSLDIDVDMDASIDVDASVDADIDTDADFDGHHGDAHDFDLDADSGGVFMALMRFLNVDQVPLMVVLSIFSLSMWMLSMMGNYYLNPSKGILIAAVVFFASVIVSGFVTKAATAPLAKAFKRMKDAEGEEHFEVIGSTGTVRSGEVSDASGQVEIETKGAPLLIHARIREGNARLKKGDTCLVVASGDVDDYYFVRSLKNETN